MEYTKIPLSLVEQYESFAIFWCPFLQADEDATGFFREMLQKYGRPLEAYVVKIDREFDDFDVMDYMDMGAEKPFFAMPYFLADMLDEIYFVCCGVATNGITFEEAWPNIQESLEFLTKSPQ